MIKVLLADDEELIRSALSALLRLEPDLDVVAEAANGREAVELAVRHRPDVAIVDLEMPLLDGFGVTGELARAVPACAVVILTGRGRAQHLKPALDAGARGFLPKGSPGGALADVIRRVHAGGRYVDPALAADALTAPDSPLSEREREILRLAGSDRPVADVARRVHLSTGTVRNHLSAAVAKLGASNRADAHRRADEAGWL